MRQLDLVRDLAAYPVRTRADCTGVVVHRIEVSQEDAAFSDTPTDVVRFFLEQPIGRKATGGKMPYPILVEADGTLTGILPLSCVTPHARAYNPTTIGVGCIGDFRRAPLTAAARAALVPLLAELLHAIGRTSDDLFGHDELAGGSADPEKECPGRFLGMAALRQEVRAAMRDSVLGRLTFLW